MIKIYRDIYYPTLHNNSHTLENTGLIFYAESISLIKKSVYGLRAKLKAINEKILKETGGKTITQPSFMGKLQAKEYTEYIPSTEEALESNKEMMLYDKIFQEFVVIDGYYDSDSQLKYNILYIKNNMKIKRLKLEEFLRKKELECQAELLTLNHRH